MVFAYYACLGGDVTYIFFNQWAQFVDDCGLASNKSKFCKKSDMDRLFIAVDTKAAILSMQQQKELKEAKHRKKSISGDNDRGDSPSPVNVAASSVSQSIMRAMEAAPSAAGEQSFRPISPPDGAGALEKNAAAARPSSGANKGPSPTSMLMTRRLAAQDDMKKAINRVEFVAALVHIAVNKYIATKKLTDVSEAVLRLLSRDIEPKLSAKAFSRPNVFRRDHCYVEGVDKVLREHEVSLRRIFAGLCAANGKTAADAQLLSLGEWKDFLRALDLMKADITERDCTLCFSWSRMCVIDERTERGHVRESSLPFEGFLEALCRLSVLKALPTDEEISAAGCDDAAAYLEQIRFENDEAFQELLKTRATEWGQEPAQPLSRCLAHLLSIIIFEIEHATQSGGGDKELSEKEVEKWARRVRSPQK